MNPLWLYLFLALCFGLFLLCGFLQRRERRRKPREPDTSYYGHWFDE